MKKSEMSSTTKKVWRKRLNEKEFNEEIKSFILSYHGGNRQTQLSGKNKIQKEKEG